jgi:hypothetical protein
MGKTDILFFAIFGGILALAACGMRLNGVDLGSQANFEQDFG